MKEPVDHILRPRLPWRSPLDERDVTECGFDANKVKTLTREEFKKRLNDYGAQRTAMLTCMTCNDTARRWCTWDEDARLALHREIEWERGGSYYRCREDRGSRLLDELMAIEDLIERHPDEFAALVAGIEQRRLWNEQKAEHAKKQQRMPRRPRDIL